MVAVPFTLRLHFFLLCLVSGYTLYFSNLVLRKAEKEEEKRAREKILQKVEADKVVIEFYHFLILLSTAATF